MPKMPCLVLSLVNMMHLCTIKRSFCSYIGIIALFVFLTPINNTHAAAIEFDITQATITRTNFQPGPFPPDIATRTLSGKFAGDFDHILGTVLFTDISVTADPAGIFVIQADSTMLTYPPHFEGSYNSIDSSFQGNFFQSGPLDDFIDATYSGTFDGTTLLMTGNYGSCEGIACDFSTLVRYDIIATAVIPLPGALLLFLSGFCTVCLPFMRKKLTSRYLE